MKKALAARGLAAALLVAGLASVAALRAQEGSPPAAQASPSRGTTPSPGTVRAGLDPLAEVEALLAEHAAAWSRGDLEGFCSVYADDVLFLSPTGVTRGREAVLARYRKRYPDRAAMGTLTLETIEARLAGVPAGGVPAAAGSQDRGVAAVTVAGRWKLSFPGREPAEGLTLVVLHRRDGRWQIVQDASM